MGSFTSYEIDVKSRNIVEIFQARLSGTWKSNIRIGVHLGDGQRTRSKVDRRTFDIRKNLADADAEESALNPPFGRQLLSRALSL